MPPSNDAPALAVNPTSTSLPVRVVVLASEQLFPALQFLLHVADRFGPALRAIHIYCTEDDRRSGAPARRLRRVLEQWLQQRGQHGCKFFLTTGTAWPDGVRAGLFEWFQLDPDCQWLVNVTGGTKPMSAAASELTLATDLPAKRVIYQEINASWVELGQNEEGFLQSSILHGTTDPVVPPRDTLERLLSVGDLVATQFSEEHHVQTQSLVGFAVDTALQSIVAHRWKWAAGLQAMQPPVPTSGNGDAFERFVGAGLHDSGLRLQHSLKVNDSSASGKVVREVDLVGCHMGRLVCIDIKLSGAQEHAKGTQLADVAELAQSLGGRGAVAIALRPGWPCDPDIERLANALGVRLLTQAHAPQLFTHLLACVDKALHPSAAVLAAQAWLEGYSAQGNEVISDGSHTLAQIPEHGTLHLPTMIERMCERRQEPWGLVEMKPGGQYFLGIPKKYLPNPEAAHWPQRTEHLRQRLKSISQPWGFSFNDSKAWVMVQLTLAAGVKAQQLRSTISESLLDATPAP